MVMFKKLSRICFLLLLVFSGVCAQDAICDSTESFSNCPTDGGNLALLDSLKISQDGNRALYLGDSTVLRYVRQRDPPGVSVIEKVRANDCVLKDEYIQSSYTNETKQVRVYLPSVQEDQIVEFHLRYTDENANTVSVGCFDTVHIGVSERIGTVNVSVLRCDGVVLLSFEWPNGTTSIIITIVDRGNVIYDATVSKSTDFIGHLVPINLFGDLLSAYDGSILAMASTGLLPDTVNFTITFPPIDFFNIVQHDVKYINRKLMIRVTIETNETCPILGKVNIVSECAVKPLSLPVTVDSNIEIPVDDEYFRVGQRNCSIELHHNGRDYKIHGLHLMDVQEFLYAVINDTFLNVTCRLAEGVLELTCIVAINGVEHIVNESTFGQYANGILPLETGSNNVSVYDYSRGNLFETYNISVPEKPTLTTPNDTRENCTCTSDSDEECTCGNEIKTVSTISHILYYIIGAVVCILVICGCYNILGRPIGYRVSRYLKRKNSTYNVNGDRATYDAKTDTVYVRVVSSTQTDTTTNDQNPLLDAKKETGEGRSIVHVSDRDVPETKSNDGNHSVTEKPPAATQGATYSVSTNTVDTVSSTTTANDQNPLLDTKKETGKGRSIVLIPGRDVPEIKCNIDEENHDFITEKPLVFNQGLNFSSAIPESTEHGQSSRESQPHIQVPSLPYNEIRTKQSLYSESISEAEPGHDTFVCGASTS